MARDRSSIRVGRFAARWPARTRCVLIALLISQFGCQGYRPFRAHDPACPDCLPRDQTVEDPRAALLRGERCTELLPHSAIPAPPGTYVNEWSDQMAAEASVQSGLVTRNLWFAGGDQLGPDGQERVRGIAREFYECPRPILVEREPLEIGAGQSYAEALEANRELNEARRSVLIDALASHGVPDADAFFNWVPDRGVGVRGIEAPLIYNRQYMGGMGMMGGRGGMGGGGFGGGGGMGGGMGGMGMMGGMGGGFGGGGMF